MAALEQAAARMGEEEQDDTLRCAQQWQQKIEYCGVQRKEEHPENDARRADCHTGAKRASQPINRLHGEKAGQQPERCH